MQILFVLLTLLYYLDAAAPGPLVDLPHCDAASTRALIRAAVERQLVLHGIPAQPQMFTLLDNLQDAKSQETATVVAQLQAAFSARFSSMRVCEVDNPPMSAPMFVTVFVAGPGIPQPSGYLLNFGVPGAGTVIGDPPQ